MFWNMWRAKTFSSWNRLEKRMKCTCGPRRETSILNYVWRWIPHWVLLQCTSPVKGGEDGTVKDTIFYLGNPNPHSKILTLRMSKWNQRIHLVLFGHSQELQTCNFSRRPQTPVWEPLQYIKSITVIRVVKSKWKHWHLWNHLPNHLLVFYIHYNDGKYVNHLNLKPVCRN